MWICSCKADVLLLVKESERKDQRIPQREASHLIMAKGQQRSQPLYTRQHPSPRPRMGVVVMVQQCVGEKMDGRMTSSTSLLQTWLRS
jgi:hypothetical protein